MTPLKQMQQCFHNLGRSSLRGTHKTTHQAMRFIAALNKTGDLYVAIYLGKGTKQYHALPLEDWAEWAQENIQMEDARCHA